MKKHPSRKLAQQIAKQLFTAGDKQMADRLVFETADGTLGVGWAIVPMTDAIEVILDAEHKPKK